MVCQYNRIPGALRMDASCFMKNTDPFLQIPSISNQNTRHFTLDEIIESKTERFSKRKET